MTKLLKRKKDGVIFVWTEVLAARPEFEELPEKEELELAPPTLEQLNDMKRPQLLQMASKCGLKDCMKLDNPTLILEIHKKIQESQTE